ncbi:MAG: flagellin [Burkholderiales bacterium]|nr:flagellin [Burkholderiales bacterium]
MSVINTNVSAMYSQNAMKTNARAMNTAMEQLSTGTRVNSAKDDAAGLAIGQNMTSQIRGLNQAVRNLNDGINMMQTAEGAMVEQSNMLQRMRELAVQSMNGTYSNTQRGYLDKEFQALTSQIGRIASDTKWNDQTLLNKTAGASGTFTYQAGQSSGQIITVSIGKMTVSGLNLAAVVASSGVTAVNAVAISSLTTATNALTRISSALETINSQRAVIGAGINRMEYAGDNLTNIASNATQSRSTIMDTDYAVATTQLAKTQIIQQAATAMLAQANQQPQSVMALLKG